RLPRGRVADELADTRADPGVVVERAHADADRVRVARVAAEQGRPARPAEPLLPAAVGLPHPEVVLPGHHPAGPGGGGRTGRHRGPAAALAARAMAVAGDGERRGDLEADGAAVAAAGEWELGHVGASCGRRGGAGAGLEHYARAPAARRLGGS